MLAGMNQNSAHLGVAPHGWLQHHLPWLALLALVLGLLREDGSDIGFDPDEMNG